MNKNNGKLRISVKGRALKNTTLGTRTTHTRARTRTDRQTDGDTLDEQTNRN